MVEETNGVQPAPLNPFIEVEQDDDPEVLLADLRNVGPKKPLGYLPISTLVDVCHTTPDAIMKEAVAKGQKAILLREGESLIPGGALYVYDEQALEFLLRSQGSVLQQYGWPNSAKKFVYKVDQVNVPEKTPLFDLIADAYADYTNPGRLRIVKKPSSG